MDVTKQYAIAWKGLKNGTYRFDFKVDNALFEAYGSTDIKDGDLSVGVTLERGESMLSLQTVIRGTVTVACDRCLEDCRLPVAFDGTLLVRFSDEVADYDGEVMWISPAEGKCRSHNIFMRASYSRCPTSGSSRRRMRRRHAAPFPDRFAGGVFADRTRRRNPRRSLATARRRRAGTTCLAQREVGRRKEVEIKMLNLNNL